MPLEDFVEGPAKPMMLSLSGLPVDQQRAVRMLVDALSYREEPRRAMEDACVEA